MDDVSDENMSKLIRFIPSSCPKRKDPKPRNGWASFTVLTFSVGVERVGAVDLQFQLALGIGVDVKPGELINREAQRRRIGGGLGKLHQKGETFLITLLKIFGQTTHMKRS